MLDPALCNRPISHWLVLKEGLTTLVMNEALVIGVLVAVLIWSLRWRRKPSRLWVRGFIVTALLLYIFVPLPPFETWAYTTLAQAVPQDSGKTADAIVILGRGDELRTSRIEAVTELWEQDRAPQIFASGRGDGPQIVSSLIARGIPADILGDENCSQTTAENAEFTATLLQPQGVEQIILVTDPPHMLRSLRTFRKLGFQIIPHFSPLPPLPQREKALIVYRE